VGVIHRCIHHLMILTEVKMCQGNPTREHEGHDVGHAVIRLGICASAHSNFSDQVSNPAAHKEDALPVFEVWV